MLDRTATLQGRVIYKRLLEEPCINQEEAEKRTAEICYFQENLASLEPFQALLKTSHFVQVVRDSTSTYIYQNTNPVEEAFLRLFQRSRNDGKLFLRELMDASCSCGPLRESNKTIDEIAEFLEVLPHNWESISRKRLSWLVFEKHQKKFSRLLECLHKLDCWISIAVVHNELALTFPQWATGLPIENWNFVGLRNIAVKDAVPNGIQLSALREHVFVTGPNMAGKTTFLKSIGQAVYLSRCGFGVPAELAVIPWISTLATAFETSGSISKRQSYFSSEVDRSIALVESCNEDGLSLLLIDELFKGTNLIDAQDCLRYFVKISSSRKVVCVIATHFANYLKKLKAEFPISNYFFEAKIDGKDLSFDYKVQKGISEQRLGLHIFSTRWESRVGGKV